MKAAIPFVMLIVVGLALTSRRHPVEGTLVGRYVVPNAVDADCVLLVASGGDTLAYLTHVRIAGQVIVGQRLRGHFGGPLDKTLVFD